MEHKALPFEKLLHELRPAREQSYHPLAQLSFSCRSATQASPDRAGLLISTKEHKYSGELVEALFDVKGANAKSPAK